MSKEIRFYQNDIRACNKKKEELKTAVSKIKNDCIRVVDETQQRNVVPAVLSQPNLAMLKAAPKADIMSEKEKPAKNNYNIVDYSSSFSYKINRNSRSRR